MGRVLVVSLLLVGCLFSTMALADVVVFSGEMTQGGLVLGKVDQGVRVFYGDRPLQIDPEGYFIVGFSKDAAAKQLLSFLYPDGTESLKTLNLRQRNYRTERIDGIRKQMMEPSPAELIQIQGEAQQVEKARQANLPLSFFRQSFIWPVHGRLTGIYGSQRILNGEPRRPHYGVDIAAPRGTKVKAPAGGIATLVHDGMFFSGKTLIIDHGHGLSSTFLHLSRIHVKQGEKIVQGQTIADVGASGRVTGPHLDWRINWFDQRLDPALLVPEMPGG